MSSDRIGGGSGRLLTRANAVGQTVLATAAFTPGSGSLSAWTEIITSAPTDYVLVGIHALTNSATDTTYRGPIQVDVSVGGSGSEVAVGTVLISGGDPTYTGTAFTWYRGGFAPLVTSLRVSSGTRVAVRGMCAAIGTATLTVSLFGVPYANLESF